MKVRLIIEMNIQDVRISKVEQITCECSITYVIIYTAFLENQVFVGFNYYLLMTD